MKVIGILLFLCHFVLIASQPPPPPPCPPEQYKDGTTCKFCSFTQFECKSCEKKLNEPFQCLSCYPPFTYGTVDFQCHLDCSAIQFCSQTGCFTEWQTDGSRVIKCNECETGQVPNSSLTGCETLIVCNPDEFPYAGVCKLCSDYGCGNRCFYDYFFKTVMCANCESTDMLVSFTRQCVPKTGTTDPDCGLGYYTEVIGGVSVCKDCGEGAKTCTQQSSVVSHTSCYDTHQLQTTGGGFCLQKLDNQCLDHRCQTCVKIGVDILCTSCKFGEIFDPRFGDCVKDRCDSGFYFTLAGNDIICQPCNIDGCGKCYFDYLLGTEKCTNCGAQYEWAGPICELRCGDRMYKHPLLKICLPFELDCDTFYLPTLECESCSPGTTHKFYEGKLKCVPNNQGMTYGILLSGGISGKIAAFESYTGQRQIVSCPNGCIECYNDFWENQIVCKQCKAGFQLNSNVCEVSNGSRECNLGFYATKSNLTGLKTCLRCPRGCKSCSIDHSLKKISCDDCDLSFQLVNRRCQTKQTLKVPKCSTIQYYGPTIQETTCIACPENCEQCAWNDYSDSLVCTECQTGFEIFNFKCIQNCAKGSYWTPHVNSNAGLTTECRKCPTSCESCLFDANYLYPSCIKCAYGFIKLSDQSFCVPVSNCVQGKMFVFFTNQPLCVDCPPSCNQCFLTNPSDPSTFQCQENCQPGFISLNGVCVSNIGNKPECDESAAKTIKLKKNTDSGLFEWECADCPSNCHFCASNQVFAIYCLQCNAGFILTQDGVCESLSQCGLGKYAHFSPLTSKIECLSCPYGTASCELKNPSDINSLKASTCSSGWSLEGNICSAPAASAASIECPQSYYFQTNRCVKCTTGCKKCSVNLESKSLECAECHLDFLLDAASFSCKSRCISSGTFWNTTACAACPDNCEACSLVSEPLGAGTGTNQTVTPTCSQCLSGFETAFDALQTSFFCGLKLPMAASCPQYSFYDQNLNRCVCDEGQLLTEDGLTCLDILKSLNQCPPQSFSMGSGICLPCSVSSGNCLICDGPSTRNCRKCSKGFWFDVASGGCVQCASGCQSCEDPYNCYQCEPGTYRFQQDFGGVTLTKCVTKDCPSGYIYSMDSFNERNRDNLLIMPDLLQTAAGAALEENSSAYESLGSIAILSGISIYDKKRLPLEFTIEFPLFQGVKVRLDCVNCLANCNSCPRGNILNSATQTCLKGTQCPYPYIKSGNVCQSPSTGEFYATVVIAAQSLGAHPLQKTLSAKCQTSVDDTTDAGTLTYVWSVAAIAGSQSSLIRSGEIIYDGKQDTQVAIDAAQATRLKEKFLDSVKLTEKRLIIPPSNLEANIKYTFQCVAQQGASSSFTATKNLIVEDVPLQGRSLEDLGVNGDQFSIVPQSGSATITEFSFTLSIGAQHFQVDDELDGLTVTEKQLYQWYYYVECSPLSVAMKIKKWNFQIQFESASALQTTVLPFVDVETDVLCSLVVSRKGETYILSKKIKLGIGQKNDEDNDEKIQLLSLAELTSLEDIQASSLGLTIQQINSVSQTSAAIFQQLRLDNQLAASSSGTLTLPNSKCAPNDECSKNGKCERNDLTGLYKCNCADGYQGVNCELNAEDAYDYMITKLALSRSLLQFDVKSDQLTAMSLLDVASDLLSDEIINKEIITNVLSATQDIIPFAFNQETSQSLLNLFSKASVSVRDQVNIFQEASNSEDTFQSELKSTIQSINNAIENTVQQLVTSFDASNSQFHFNSGGGGAESDLQLAINWIPVPQLEAAAAAVPTASQQGTATNTAAHTVAMSPSSGSLTKAILPLAVFNNTSQVLCSLLEQDSSYINHIVDYLSKPAFAFQMTGLRCFFINGTEYVLANLTQPLKVWIPSNENALKHPETAQIALKLQNQTACNYITTDQNQKEIGFATEGCTVEHDENNSKGAWCQCDHATKFTQMPVTQKFVVIEEEIFDIVYVEEIYGTTFSALFSFAGSFTLLSLIYALVI